MLLRYRVKGVAGTSDAGNECNSTDIIKGNAPMTIGEHASW